MTLTSTARRAEAKCLLRARILVGYLGNIVSKIGPTQPVFASPVRPQPPGVVAV